jgi:two-component system invasion response regulator UvrY
LIPKFASEVAQQLANFGIGALGSSTVSGVLVVDDHPAIAEVCARMLEPIGIEKVISASTADAAYRAFVENEPDLAVIDLSLHGEDRAGITLIKRIRAYNTKARILVFSMRSDRKSFMSAIAAGATSYVIKDSPTDEFTKAVETTRSGRHYIDPQLALNLAFAKNASLSHREQRILDRLREDVADPG